MSNESAIRRDVGAIALMYTGLGSIIGSGWLFGAWRAAQLAGPGAVWAWVIGAVVILCVAFAYAELGAMFPESGGAVRYGHYSHGSLVGFVAGWAAWIAIVSVIPVEAEASVQYMSSWPWDWTHALYVHAANGQGELTPPGLAISALLVVVYFLINFWGVKLFAETNSVITFIKLVVPAGTAIALICSSFHRENFQIGIHGGAHATDLASILTAVATSGIVFSYNGFQTPVNLAGESRNPGRDVPFGIFGSLAISTVVYLLLQVAFLGAVAPEHLGQGWAALEFSSPFAQLALALNLNWLALMLYADAFVSPSGTGSTYTATTARMIYAMERSATLPKVLGEVHPRFGIPRPAMWFNLAVSFIFLFFFRGWGDCVPTRKADMEDPGLMIVSQDGTRRGRGAGSAINWLAMEAGDVHFTRLQHGDEPIQFYLDGQLYRTAPDFGARFPKLRVEMSPLARQLQRLAGGAEPEGPTTQEFIAARFADEEDEPRR